VGNESAKHPPAELLAALCEPGSAKWPEPELLQHLARCPRCTGTYAGLVDMQLHDPRAHRIIDSWGVRFEPKRSASRAVSDLAAARRGLQRRRFQQLLAAASITVAVGTIFWRPFGRDRELVPTAAQRTALVQRLRLDSPGGMLYADAWLPLPQQGRGATPASEAALDMQRLVEAYKHEDPSPELAYWLVAGFLASNDSRNAHAFLNECIGRFPREARLQHLAGMLAYKESRLAEAEQHWRAALAMGSSASTLVDLAILKRERGFESEAQKLLQEVQTRFRGTEVAGYARGLD
jgi:hypothetical protein